MTIPNDHELIRKFYDEFAEAQRKKGVNDRIFSLYKRVLAAGLKSSSTFLELGCGIGALSFLLSKTIKKGYVESVDLSPESIAYAKQKIKKNNFDFFEGDITTYRANKACFDFVSLFDVLEHVPMPEHARLFQNTAQYANNDTKILINIPNPYYIEYEIQKRARGLQIIDQPVHLPRLIKDADSAGLKLCYFETYSIWVKEDYQFMIFAKKQKFEEKLVSQTRNFLQKVQKKAERSYIRNRYKY